MTWVIVSAECDPLAETLLLVLSNGDTVMEMMMDFVIDGAVVTLSGVHLYGGGPNTIGPGGLRELALRVKKELGLDQLRIYGAARATGARPGRRPGPLVF